MPHELDAGEHVTATVAVVPVGTAACHSSIDSLPFEFSRTTSEALMPPTVTADAVAPPPSDIATTTLRSAAAVPMARVAKL